ncbi:MAG: RsmB/NOP family class I SAM-dependent RNA methyltransferase [Egibacteraceae bacterium]
MEAEGLASRRLAWEVLRRVHADGAWSTLALSAALRRARLDARDRAFAANLAYSTLRWEGTLDWALGRVLARPLHEVEAALLDVLRLGAWQVLYGGTPDRAAVATTVDLARAVVGPRATGFTNGVLRGLVRTRDRLPWPSVDTDFGLGLALGYPSWVVAEARGRFGDRARAVLEAGNEAPGVTLRATGDRKALLAELAAAGLDASPGLHAPEAVRAPGADPSRMTAVAEGRAVAQDEASMLVARAAVAGLSPGALALDTCAAPGGKSTHLAQLGFRVVAADLRPGRAELVASAAARLGLRVAVAVADGLAPPWRPGAFPLVLVDAPCTGLGTVHRRPEVRWRRQPGDPARMGALQLALLERAAPLVGPGGRLLYSVCTWPRAETADVARAFLAAHGDRFAAETPDLAGAGTHLPGDPGTQLTGDLDRTDAMYVCAFPRRRQL